MRTERTLQSLDDNQLPGALVQKAAALDKWLAEAETLLVAYSGGIDSTLLSFLAHQQLGDKMLAVTAYSEIYPARETRQAEEIALQLGIPFEKIRSYELRDDRFAENGPLRCYHCKNELFARLGKLATDRGLAVLADGQNLDDANDFRPGAKAARELGIVSPLREHGFTKDDIRRLAKHHSLPNWDKPPHPCLSTRFPYGAKLEDGRLKKVENVETFLFDLGFKDLRLRIHDKIVRLEVEPEDFPLLLDEKIRRKVIDRLLLDGYTHVTMDLEGLVSGKMNRELKRKDGNSPSRKQETGNG